MPLIHRPGEAQVDFGYALAKVSGDLRKIAFFVMSAYPDVFPTPIFNPIEVQFLRTIKYSVGLGYSKKIKN
jgi:hypothetical protein